MLKTGKNTSGIWRAATGALLAFALSGCISDGASSFTNALDVRPTAASSAPQTPVPLNVATVDPAQGARPLPAPSETNPLDGAITQRSLVAEESRQLAALAPVDPGVDALPGQPATTGDLASTPALSIPVDPLEAEAEARAEALYAAMKHGECKGGWGPPPKMINARRVDPAHKYYMEMRLRHTPPLPVGHVYIAYGRVGPDGQPLDEKLVMLAPVGGYAGATVAAAAPVTGVLTPYGDDCVLNPIAAYRVSLSAQNYEKLLQRIVQAQGDKPRYALWTYNCNHFMSDVAQSVGILPPENKYTPSLEYFYAMMDRNEGRKVDRSPASETRELATAQFGGNQ